MVALKFKILVRNLFDPHARLVDRLSGLMPR